MGVSMVRKFSDKSELEKTLIAGINGVELQRDEKRRYLGHFRERVIQAVTFDQLRTAKGLNAMKQALKHHKAAELVVRNKARTQAMPLIVEAQRLGVDFTVVSNPQFIGDVAVALVAREAVDVPRLMSEE
jgi:uncharacterized protein YueI